MYIYLHKIQLCHDRNNQQTRAKPVRGDTWLHPGTILRSFWPVHTAAGLLAAQPEAICLCGLPWEAGIEFPDQHVALRFGYRHDFSPLFPGVSTRHLSWKRF